MTEFSEVLHPAVELVDDASSEATRPHSEPSLSQDFEAEAIDTRYGPMIVPAGEDLIGNFLRRFGEWGWLEASFAATLLGDDARVLDGGAFLGTFGLAISMCRPDTFVCYVEVNPAVAPVLRRNVDRPGRADVVVSAMLAAPGSSVRVGQQETGNLGSASYAQQSRPALLAGAAETATTLLDLRNAHGPFDLIKLDLEGMEAEALSGDAGFLSSGRTTLWLECNEDPRSLHLARILLDWGLPLYYFAFPTFNPRNYNGDPSPVYPMAYEAALLAAPRSLPVLTDAFQAAHCILKPVRTIHDLKLAMWRTPRWGVAGWDEASKPEVAALATRLLRSETFESFLRGAAGDMQASATAFAAPDDATAELRRLLETERTERAAVDAALQEASELAIARLHELSQERERREAVDTAMQEASALAIGRLDELSKECERREVVEAALREASALAIARLDEMNEERRKRAAAEADRLEALELAEARDAERIEEGKRREAAETGLARMSARSLAQLSALGEARERAEQAEAVARGLPALDRELERLRVSEANLMTALEAANQTRQWSEDRATLAEQKAAMFQQVIAIYQTSTVWRVSAPMRALVGRAPSLRRTARLGRRLLGKVVPGLLP